MTTATTTLTIDSSRDAMSSARLARAYGTEIGYELLRMLRTPGFSIPFLALPVPLYLFFGLVVAGPAIADNPGVANYLFCSWLVFAAMMPALFGVGCALALERDAGLLRLKRAWPAPGGAYIAAKMAAATLLATIGVLSVIVAALVTGSVTLSAGQIAIIALCLIAGTIPLSAIGLFIGAHTSGSAAPAVTNIVFLPMLWLSGLFIPLPAFLKSWVILWPAFHLNQLALGAAGVSEFTFIAPQIAAAVLAGFTVLFGGLAIRGLAKKG